MLVSSLIVGIQMLTSSPTLISARVLAARNTPNNGDDPQADFSSRSSADLNFLEYEGHHHPHPWQVPVTHSHVPEDHGSDLYVRPLVLRKRRKVPFDQYVRSEPSLLHLEINVLVTIRRFI